MTQQTRCGKQNAERKPSFASSLYAHERHLGNCLVIHRLKRYVSPSQSIRDVFTCFIIWDQQRRDAQQKKVIIIIRKLEISVTGSQRRKKMKEEKTTTTTTEKPQCATSE